MIATPTARSGAELVTIERRPSTRRTEHALALGREVTVGHRAGWFAEVVYPNGRRLELSLLDGEPAWAIDADWLPSGMPRHVNGFGARYVRVERIAGELGDLLDAAAEQYTLAVQGADSATCPTCGDTAPWCPEV